jgi:hypothetical protein
MPDGERTTQRARRTVAHVLVPVSRHGEADRAAQRTDTAVKVLGPATPAEVQAAFAANGLDYPTGDDVIPMIEITDSGKIMYDGMVIGLQKDEEHNLPDGFKVEPVIVLDLGWCKMAGVHVRVLDDPEVDHHRDGKVLDR